VRFQELGVLDKGARVDDRGQGFGREISSGDLLGVYRG
jgi:hypothetical protein